MRLTSIKLSGFKSFVDSTTFRAPTNLTGIVGPNGCGKSNIIDAVRWVMGEGSARVLRGELMSDVIFSGSTTRKPVGTATVELIFDNSDGQIGGEYAPYAEIAVKRTVGRDGISQYTLNGQKCRRKDIKDLFLGTGLGSTSYSIIEQGMISQVVDARPEEIRQHLEEAAGISRYKDRRRETERRIAHTRENLDRLSDLREEISNHLARLKRQASAAERYRNLKQQQRELESRLLALRWREQVRQAASGKSALGLQETALQEQIAAQRAAEAEMEALHERQAGASEHFNEVQGAVYAAAADIARLEQTIQHRRDLQRQQQQEYDEVTAALKDLEQHMMLDRTQVEQLTADLADIEPALKQAEQVESAGDTALLDCESAVQAWQEEFEAHHRRNAEWSRASDALKSRIELLEQRQQDAAARLVELEQETAALPNDEPDDASGALGSRVEAASEAESRQRATHDGTRESCNENRGALAAARQREHEIQNRLNAARGRLEALKAVQLTASDSEKGRQWLARSGLGDAPQLASLIETDAGWETAVETVLGSWLQGLTVERPSGLAEHLGSLEDSALDLVDAASGQVRPRSGTLAEKVRAPDAIVSLLNHVRIVADLEQALPFLDLAVGEETAITRQGEWVGPGWIRITRGEGQGVLQREQAIRELEGQVAGFVTDLSSVQAQIEDLASRQQDLEDALDREQLQLADAQRLKAELETRLAAQRERSDEIRDRRQKLVSDRDRFEKNRRDDQKEIRELRSKLEKSLDSMAGEEATRVALEKRRKPLLEARDRARREAQSARDTRHELALKAGSARASLDSLQQSLARMDNQASQLQQRYLSLAELNALATDPEADFKSEMDSLLATRVEKDEALGAARAALQTLETEYRQMDRERQQAMRGADEIRSNLERARLQQQEIELTARSLAQRVTELGAAVEALAEDLPETADVASWEQDIERLGVRIGRLEPVNLAAISEYEEELKRKEYMDAQHEDLVKALETLENAIARIDRKTRTRFKDTFEEVNKGVQELYPRLFGGGHAYLELTGDDLLTTGVSIMARPPGKRVSSIHLLSGGEKALTAVAFVFAIFLLNPAPFCLLDEVDAPLDDANVGRFSALVKEMSETVQFIVVTHNKITMEMVHQLSGVTMREPGVSRLVQVDIDEAAKLAAS